MNLFGSFMANYVTLANLSDYITLRHGRQPNDCACWMGFLAQKGEHQGTKLKVAGSSSLTGWSLNISQEVLMF